jgi:hypothetical protein
MLNKIYTLSWGIANGSATGALFGICTGTALSKIEKKTENKVLMIERVTIGGAVVGGFIGSFITNTPLSACILSSVCVPYYIYNKYQVKLSEA